MKPETRKYLLGLLKSVALGTVCGILLGLAMDRLSEISGRDEAADTQPSTEEGKDFAMIDPLHTACAPVGGVTQEGFLAGADVCLRFYGDMPDAAETKKLLHLGRKIFASAVEGYSLQALDPTYDMTVVARKIREAFAADPRASRALMSYTKLTGLSGQAQRAFGAEAEADMRALSQPVPEVTIAGFNVPIARADLARLAAGVKP